MIQSARSPNDPMYAKRLFSFSIDGVSSFYAIGKPGPVNYSHVKYGGDVR